MNVDIFKDATSKLTSNIIPNKPVFIFVMSMSQLELTPTSLIKNCAKTWLNTVFTITLMICCFLGVICIEHLVFYRLFQLINSSNKPIPVYSYQYNQCDMYTSVHVTC